MGPHERGHSSRIHSRLQGADTFDDAATKFDIEMLEPHWRNRPKA
jgi:hypothetical protein